MSKVSEQKRRAAARAERRARSEQHSPDDDGAVFENGDEPVLDPSDALRTAASAAIAGAAVGAAKAIARRRQHAEVDQMQNEAPDEEPARVDEDEDEPGSQPVDGAVDEPVAERSEPQREPDADPEPEPEPEPEVHRPAEPGEVSRIVQRAREQLRELRGMDAESVSSIKRTQDGWRIGLDVVEMKRIPESTDVLGTYEVDLDDDGNLLTFERTARYHRSEAERR